MAKDTKKTEKVEKGGTLKLSAINEESVLDQIKNANRFSDEIVKLAEEKADKEEKERMAKELKDKATYVNISSVLRTRLVRAQEKAISKAREDSRTLLEEVIAGKLTAVEYNDKIDASITEANKAVDAAIKEYDQNKKELRNKFPHTWSWDWDNPMKRIRSINND